MPAFTAQRRVEFRDTDAAGIVHFSAFFPMMEAAEHELLRSLGISIMDHGNPEQLTWPRVSASCDYQAAARFEDLLAIEVTIAKIGTSSIDFDFQFLREDQKIANGRITTVCCHLKPGKGLEKQPIPDTIRQLLAKHG
jgi:4-hydroxybenzoyl-CoA thioesterase/acyl-CoA thioester hydrolase